MNALFVRDAHLSLPSEPSLRRGQTAALSILLALVLVFDGGAGAGWELGAALGILAFGLPHGAYDLDLLMRGAGSGGGASQTGRRLDPYLILAYLSLAGVAIALWAFSPATALFLFLAMAGVHFGEDWDMLEAGLLRTTVGFGPLVIVAITSRAEVEAIFASLSDAETAQALMALCIMTAPVVLLITAVSLAIAWRRGHPIWCAAYGISLMIAAIAPPVVGFAAFFVLFHSALHLSQTRALLPDIAPARMALQGAALSALAIAGGWLLFQWFPADRAAQTTLAVFAFQLLAVVTVPHLLLTHRWIRIPSPAQ